MEKPLINSSYLLQKFPGKGGWTYASIPEILQDKHAYFGWVKVSGSIDNFEIKNYHLMPMGDGTLFLPVKGEIRKVIGKEAGDMVHIVLHADHFLLDIPENLKLCLEDEPVAKINFERLSQTEQKAYIDWIAASHREEVQIERLIKTIDRLAIGLRLTDK
jgi:hypothetical protein